MLGMAVHQCFDELEDEVDGLEHERQCLQRVNGACECSCAKGRLQVLLERLVALLQARVPDRTEYRLVLGVPADDDRLGRVKEKLDAVVATIKGLGIPLVEGFGAEE